MVLCPELIEVFAARRKILTDQLQARSMNPDDFNESEKDFQGNQNNIQDPDSPFFNHKLAQTGGNPLAIIVP